MPVLLFFNAVLRYNIRMTMRKSQKFFYSCLVFLLGVGLAEYVPLSGTVILVLIGAVAVGLIFWKQKRLALVFVLFFLFGFLRLHLARYRRRTGRAHRGAEINGETGRFQGESFVKNRIVPGISLWRPLVGRVQVVDTASGGRFSVRSIFGALWDLFGLLYPED